MDQSAIDTNQLWQRLERVERENRRMKLAGSLLAVGISALALLGQGTPKVASVIEAERFIVRDASGAVRAELSSAAGGKAQLVLNEGRGQPRVELQVRQDGLPNLTLRGDDVSRNIILSVGSDTGGLGLIISEAGFGGLIQLATSPFGSEFILRSKAIKAGARVSTRADGSTGIWIEDAGGKTRALIGVDSGRRPGVMVTDSDGKTRVELGLNAAGGPSLSLAESDGTRRAHLTVMDGTSSLTITDRTGASRAGLSVQDDGTASLLLAK